MRTSAPNFENVLLVWSPHQQVHSDSFESIQRRILKLLPLKCDGICLPMGIPYENPLQIQLLSPIHTQAVTISHFYNLANKIQFVKKFHLMFLGLHLEATLRCIVNCANQ